LLLLYSLLGAQTSYNLFLRLKIVLFQDLISEVSVSPNSEDDSGSYNDASDSQLNIVNYEKGKD
jgi:hypothetical protein